jgi:hypothetical protein
MWPILGLLIISFEYKSQAAQIENTFLTPKASLVTAPPIHPECESMGTNEGEIERSTYFCRNLPVYNSYSIRALHQDIEMANYPSSFDQLHDSLPEQSGWILKDFEIIPVYKRITSQSIQYIDIEKKQVIYQENLEFDLAQVYLTNHRSRSPSIIDNLDYTDSIALESKFFEVESQLAPPLVPNGNYEFSPETEGNNFDLVQVFIRLSQITKWFIEKDHNLGDKVKATIHLTSEDNINNGSYLPDTGNGPQIKIGKGDGYVMQHLARDLDVIAHEYSHHIIYQTLKTAQGDSGILHEALADYFAYAISGDPNLAETILYLDRPLRTALLPAEFKFNREGLSWSKHSKSQFYSRLLWLQREDSGNDFDKVVLKSLAFLKPQSSLHDGILAILLASDDPALRCSVMQKALSLGFDDALSGIDGSECGFKFAELPKPIKAKRKKQLIDPGVVGCSTVSHSNSMFAFLYLLSPMLVWTRYRGTNVKKIVYDIYSNSLYFCRLTQLGKRKL